MLNQKQISLFLQNPMDHLQPTFSNTERGGEVLTVGGYDYIERKDRRLLNGQKTGVAGIQKSKCSAIVKTLNGEVLHNLGWSNHSFKVTPLNQW